MDRLILPIGHYLGPDRPEPAEHRVRVGATIRSLPVGDPYTVWVLAHGLADQVRERRWTAEALAAVAGLEPARIELVAAELAAAGLLVEVAPGGPDAVSFARLYRLCPLLSGLGWRPELGGGFALGVGAEPIAVLPEFTYELWQWAAVAGSLWDLCRGLADADSALADPDPALTDADRVLVDPAWFEGRDEPDTLSIVNDSLAALHLLLAQHGGYLDEC